MAQKLMQNGNIKNHLSEYSVTNQTEELKETAKSQLNYFKPSGDDSDKEEFKARFEFNKDNTVEKSSSSEREEFSCSSSDEEDSQNVFSNGKNSQVDDGRMIMEVIFSGLMGELKYFDLKNKSLNYLRSMEQLRTVDTKVSPLMVAAYCGNVDHVRELFTSGAEIDVNFPSKKLGMSALMVACMRGQFEVMQLLISRGGDVSQCNRDGQTPLYFCFTRMGEDTNFFENKNLCFKMAELLLDNGASINQTVDSRNQHSLLMQFCNVSERLTEHEKDINISTIKFLIGHGADIMLKDSLGLDCYDLLENHPCKEEVIQLLHCFENTMFTQIKDSSSNSKTRSISPQQRAKTLTGTTTRKKSQTFLTFQSQTQSQSQSQSTHHQHHQLPSKQQHHLLLEGEEKKYNPCCSLFPF